MLFERWFPDEVCPSAYAVDYEALASEGIRGVIFDIDNTLVPHGAPADEAAAALFGHLRKLGLSACLISNNSEPRVKPFADAVGARYLHKAGKPSGRGYREACRMMGVSPREAVFIGDQIFTDIWGAKRAGIRCILTDPIDPKEEIQIILKRIPEKLVMAAYRRHLRKKSEKP